jgi:hypothetical protein
VAASFHFGGSGVKKVKKVKTMPPTWAAPNRCLSATLEDQKDQKSRESCAASLGGWVGEE